MSVNYYNLKWEECISQLTEQIEDEGLPMLERSNNPNARSSDVEWFQFYGTLYIKYIDIYRKLEDCYDQLTHPQKRQLLKEMLTNTMIRMCEIKQNVVKHSTHSQVVQSEFINFDELVMDLKLTPRCLEVPIPRYFAEEDRKRLDERNGLVKKLMLELHDTCQPEEEVVVDTLQLDTNSQTAIRIIQKLERGRQGILRLIEASKFRKNMGLKRKVSLVEEQSEESKLERFATALQKYVRAHAARRQFASLREGELTFLGIVKHYEQDDVQKIALQNRQQQKKVQQSNEEKMLEDRQRIRSEITMAEGGNMRVKMLDERRKWIRNYLFISDFRLLPNKPSDFYKLDKDDAQKESASPKKKKPLPEVSPKKKTKPKVLLNEDNSGPSQLVVQLQDSIQQHNRQWSYQQVVGGEPYNVELVKSEVRPEVETSVRQIVDAMIALELDNMRIKYGIRKRKEKRKKKAKKKKAKKVKIPLGLGKRDPRDLLAQLVDLKVVKLLKPAHMSDFKGQINPLGSLQERLADLQPDPSYAQLREVIIENIAIPLGSAAAKTRLEKKRWFLFYGPTGTGKTLVIRAIQTECNCIVMDLSPDNLEGKLKDKKDLKRIFWMSIIVAKYFQPALILVEDVETILQQKKKKKKDHFFGVKLRKPLVELKKNKLWEKTDRIAVIGCSNKPYNGDLKAIKKMFHRHYYFPYPNYATRRLLFEAFLTEKLGKHLPSFPYGTICQISEGFTAGSVRLVLSQYRQCIERVLTEARIKRLEEQPLKLAQFVQPLANTYCTYSEEYDRLRVISYQLQKFTDEVTGNRERRELRSKLQLVESTKAKAGRR